MVARSFAHGWLRAANLPACGSNIWSSLSGGLCRGARAAAAVRRGKPPTTAGLGAVARMCGIVGYVGPREVRPLLLAGLEQLEYRGYDSAGISVLTGDRIDAVRAVGNLSRLRDALGRAGDGAAADHDQAAAGQRPPAVAVADRPGTGIGHTRWATHGRVTEENAHPHFDTAGRIHIVVNGIVENYVDLKARLHRAGAKFTSE